MAFSSIDLDSFSPVWRVPHAGLRKKTRRKWRIEKEHEKEWKTSLRDKYPYIKLYEFVLPPVHNSISRGWVGVVEGVCVEGKGEGGAIEIFVRTQL